MQDHQNGESKEEAAVAGTAVPAAAEAQEPQAATEQAPTRVVIETSLGDIEAELFADKAPETVKNFLAYVEGGHYTQTIFHRVIKDFMIQGGGMTADMNQKPTARPIKNEASNGLKNEVGTLAMARTSAVDSATAQFFINTKDNAFLDHKNDTPSGYGYCVFGRVILGTDVVRLIEQQRTASKGMHQDVPVEPVIIKAVKLVS